METRDRGERRLIEITPDMRLELKIRTQEISGAKPQT